MSTNDNDRLTHIHNQGGIDASNDINHPPHGALAEFLASMGTQAREEQVREENEAYKKGQDQHDKNTKGWSLF